MILVGAAYQAGALPVSAEAIEHAIRLNGVAVDANIQAFRGGPDVSEAPARRLRGATGSPGGQPPSADGAAPAERSLGRTCSRCAPGSWPRSRTRPARDDYAGFVERVRAREAAVTGGEALTRAVAENLYKLTAYKDEYEVARLSLDPALDEAVRAQFGDGARYAYRLHPPVLRALGLKHKVSLGPWFRPAFATLVAMRRLRGTRLDPFGRTEVRRTERALIAEYRRGHRGAAGRPDRGQPRPRGPDRGPARHGPRLRGHQAGQRPRLPREAGRAPRRIRRVNVLGPRPLEPGSLAARSRSGSDGAAAS